MLRFFLRRRARRLDQYWQALSGHDAPPAPPPGLPADLAEQTRWLHGVSQALSPTPPATTPGQPAPDTPTPARPASATQSVSGASTGSLLLAVLVVSGLIVAATRVAGGSHSGATAPMPTHPVDAANPFLGASMPPEVHNFLNAMLTHVLISDYAQAIDVAVTDTAVWVATTADQVTEAATTGGYAMLYRVPFDTFTGVEFRAGTPTATLRPSPPLTFAGDIGRILAAYGSLWVAGVSQTGEGRLLRMDPDSGVILNEFTLDTQPADMVAMDGAIWVGAQYVPRMWRVSGDGAVMQPVDVADPGAGLTHIPASTPGDPGLWYLPHANYFDGRHAIDFARMVGRNAVDPTQSDASTCAPVGSDHVGVSDAERERPLAFTECHLWVISGFAAVSIYPLESGAEPEQILDFEGHVDQILPDGEHVHVVVSEPSAGKYPDIVLYTIGPDGEYEREQLDDVQPGSLAFGGLLDTWGAEHWLWIAAGNVRRGTQMIARPRPELPAAPPAYPPTPAPGSPDATAPPVASP